MKKQNFEKFITHWNRDAFISNLSFTLKLHQFGISFSELTNPTRILGGISWDTPYGKLENIEGMLFLDETKENKSPNNKDNRLHVKYYQKRLNEGKAIAIMWDTGHVCMRAERLNIKITEAQAMNILRNLQSSHDAKYGITWETVDFYLAQLQEVSHHG